MILAFSRLALLIYVLALTLSAAARAEPVTIHFTARIGSGTSIDTGDVFGEGLGANLAGQVITGSVTIDPASLTLVCDGNGAYYGDLAAARSRSALP